MRALGGRAAIAALAVSLPMILAACGHAGAASSSPDAPAGPGGPAPVATPLPSGGPVPPKDRTELFVAPGPIGPIGPSSSTA